MKPSEAIKEYLLAHGWQYKGSCNCGGMPTQKYELIINGSEFKLKVRATSYLISWPGVKFKKYPISELKQMLNEIDKSVKESA